MLLLSSLSELNDELGFFLFRLWLLSVPYYDSGIFGAVFGGLVMPGVRYLHGLNPVFGGDY